MNSSGRKFTSIDACGAGFCAALSLLSCLTVLWPLLAYRDRVEAHGRQLIAQRSRTAALAANVRQAKLDLDAMKQDIAANPLVLQGEDRLNNRLSDITAFAKTCHLEIEDLTPGTPASGNRYDSVPVRLSGRGGYGSCIEFLHTLHAHFLDVGITSFRLSGNPDDPTRPLLAQFELVWYAKSGPIAATE